MVDQRRNCVVGWSTGAYTLMERAAVRTFMLYKSLSQHTGSRKNRLTCSVYTTRCLLLYHVLLRTRWTSDEPTQVFCITHPSKMCTAELSSSAHLGRMCIDELSLVTHPGRMCTAVMLCNSPGQDTNRWVISCIPPGQILHRGVEVHSPLGRMWHR